MSKKPQAKNNSEPKDRPKRGRPKGAKTRELTSVCVDKVPCEKCRSTERTVIGTRTYRHQGQTPDGQLYNCVVWRRCRCNHCKTFRTEKSFEFRIAEKQTA